MSAATTPRTTPRLRARGLRRERGHVPCRRRARGAVRGPRARTGRDAGRGDVAAGDRCLRRRRRRRAGVIGRWSPHRDTAKRPVWPQHADDLQRGAPGIGGELQSLTAEDDVVGTGSGSSICSRSSFRVVTLASPRAAARASATGCHLDHEVGKDDAAVGLDSFGSSKAQAARPRRPVRARARQAGAR